VSSVIALGRAGTLIDWHGEQENRAYLSSYAAESILNWRQVRIEGHLKLSLVVLRESAPGQPKEDDPFVVEDIPQLRVLKLVPSQGGNGKAAYSYQVEIWQELPAGGERREWQLVRTVTPVRLGKPLSRIPF